ncbi:hypothetical protein EDD16DRAFT_28600 [Pisolithus croceorrhizus]|nr:hypothetical protein EV401DRAFT_1619931 [Pisolithus croceorrhizus]KAI6128967.1 hypothetical protein EDD16DRAFT_28600 [Pisolithus croceorrhizus]KAI6162364.1 hypothetical protein EDD17DRAFT_564023 [Pisolithus thermaeus]
MPPNKNRVYVALYVRGGQVTMPGGEDKYHWALLTGPKSISEISMGNRFHAKERMMVVSGRPQSIWQFEERDIKMTPTAMILIRVVVAKIVDEQRLEHILRHNVPIRPGNPGWNCVTWVKEAYETLVADGGVLGTHAPNWQTIRDATMWYAGYKARMHRFDEGGKFDATKVATLDVLRNGESDFRGHGREIFS